MTSTRTAPKSMPLVTGAEACTAADGFFLDSYAPERPEVVAAKAMCGRCPLLRVCFVWALAHPAMTYDGIWRATTPGQRRVLRRGLRDRLGPQMSRTLRAESRRPSRPSPTAA